MRKAALLVLIVFAPQVAAAASRGGIKLLASIPEAYWGTWAPGTGPCKSGDTDAIVLSEKSYAGPLGTCDVASVSESSSPKGPVYSARLQCADPGQAQKKTPANLIIRPGETNQISVGPGFESLKTYRRCSESTPAPKQ